MVQVIRFEQRRLGLVPIRDYDSGEEMTQKPEIDRASSADKWLTSLHKSVSLALANFSREAARELMRLLRSGNITPDQARPGEPLSCPSCSCHCCIF